MKGNTLPTYDEFHERLTDYISRFQNPHQGYLHLTNLVNARGVPVTFYTLRQHHQGRYGDVKLTLAGAVLASIDADRPPPKKTELLEGFEEED